MTVKFKTGDKVKASGKWAGSYVIDRVEKDGYLLRGIGPANGFYLEDEDLVAANSTTNPVVKNALASKNAKFSVGDTVMVPDVYGNYKKLIVSSVSSGGTLYRLAFPTGADAGLFAANLIVRA